MHLDELIGVAPDTRRVITKDSAGQSYDYLILAAGSVYLARPRGLAALRAGPEVGRGRHEHPPSAPARVQAESARDPALQERLLTFVLIAGGPTGVELAEDMKFAEEAAAGGLTEVALGELAQQQAKDQQVAQFGERMVQDHGPANEKLMSIAQQKGIELPQDLPEDAQQKYEELQQLSDAEFDQAYMDELKDHEEDIELFEQQAEFGEDPDLARLCGGDPSDAARAPRTRERYPVADD